MLPKTSAYVKSYHGQTKWIYFLMKDDDLLEKYNTIWDKVCADIKKELDSEPVFYNKEFLKTKVKSHGDEITDFYDENIAKVDSRRICLAVITLDSALRKYDLLSASVFEECKCPEKKVIRHINDNLIDFSSSDMSDEE